MLWLSCRSAGANWQNRANHRDRDTRKPAWLGTECPPGNKREHPALSLKAESWKPEAESWKLEAGSWKLEAGSWKLEAGSW
jgi:hypothetical protein